MIPTGDDMAVGCLEEVDAVETEYHRETPDVYVVDFDNTLISQKTHKVNEYLAKQATAIITARSCTQLVQILTPLLLDPNPDTDPKQIMIHHVIAQHPQIETVITPGDDAHTEDEQDGLGSYYRNYMRPFELGVKAYVKAYIETAKESGKDNNEEIARVFRKAIENFGEFIEIMKEHIPFEEIDNNWESYKKSFLKKEVAATNAADSRFKSENSGRTKGAQLKKWIEQQQINPTEVKYIDDSAEELENVRKKVPKSELIMVLPATENTPFIPVHMGNEINRRMGETYFTSEFSQSLRQKANSLTVGYQLLKDCVEQGRIYYEWSDDKDDLVTKGIDGNHISDIDKKNKAYNYCLSSYRTKDHPAIQFTKKNNPWPQTLDAEMIDEENLAERAINGRADVTVKVTCPAIVDTWLGYRDFLLSITDNGEIKPKEDRDVKSTKKNQECFDHLFRLDQITKIVEKKLGFTPDKPTKVIMANGSEYSWTGQSGNGNKSQQTYTISCTVDGNYLILLINHNEKIHTIQCEDDHSWSKMHQYLFLVTIMLLVLASCALAASMMTVTWPAWAAWATIAIASIAIPWLITYMKNRFNGSNYSAWATGLGLAVAPLITSAIMTAPSIAAAGKCLLFGAQYCHSKAIAIYSGWALYTSACAINSYKIWFWKSTTLTQFRSIIKEVVLGKRTIQDNDYLHVLSVLGEHNTDAIRDNIQKNSIEIDQASNQRSTDDELGGASDLLDRIIQKELPNVELISRCDIHFWYPRGNYSLNGKNVRLKFKDKNEITEKKDIIKEMLFKGVDNADYLAQWCVEHINTENFMQATPGVLTKLIMSKMLPIPNGSSFACGTQQQSTEPNFTQMNISSTEITYNKENHQLTIRTLITAEICPGGEQDTNKTYRYEVLETATIDFSHMSDDTTEKPTVENDYQILKASDPVLTVIEERGEDILRNDAHGEISTTADGGAEESKSGDPGYAGEDHSPANNLDSAICQAAQAHNASDSTTLAGVGRLFDSSRNKGDSLRVQLLTGNP